MQNERYLTAMRIGCLFNDRGYNEDNRTEEWTCSEECATVAVHAASLCEEKGLSLPATLDAAVNGVLDKKVEVRDCGWDDMCRGFLAGQILGPPTKENVSKAELAERLWYDAEKYGYYHQCLEDVRDIRV